MVDAVFAERWGEDYSPMQARPDALKGSAATWAFPERDSHSLAELVRAVVQDNALGLPIPPRYSDIAILTRNKTHSQMYVTAMRKLSVPVRHEGSKRFYARMTLRDVANTLEAAARPNSDFALLCTLHSPIGGLSLDSVIQLAVKAKAAGTSVRAACSTFECPTAEDADALARFLAWFLPACEEADRIRAWELIGKILHHSPLQIQIARLPDAPLEVANLNKLLIMAVNQPTATPIEFADQLRKVLMLRHEEEDADWSSQSEESVTLMNVHQSKGLEFPLVIIPSVHENIRKVRSSGSLVHRGLGLVHVGKLEHSMASKWLKDRVADEGSAEEQRVLYVAMTRAEKGLLIGTAMKPSSWGKLVHESLEALAPDRGFPKWQQPE